MKQDDQSTPFAPSAVPVEVFPAQSEAIQREALLQSPQMRKYAACRQAAKDHIHNPSYHLYAPDGMLNDPNGLCFWQGKYHLFYQLFPPEDPRPHWGHACSEDLLHWEDLPIAIYPSGVEHGVWSGGTVVEAQRVVAMYHGRGAGNMVAISRDPLLLNWEKLKSNPVIPSLSDDEVKDGRPYIVFDPFIWKEGNTYFSLSGALNGSLDKRGKDHRNEMIEHLFCSQDLEHWTYMGDFSPIGYPQLPRGNDGACPYFLPFGHRHILFIFSHTSGAHAFIGDYDPETHRFTPDRIHTFNFGPVGCSSYQAPCAMSDGSGGLYLIFNAKDGDVTLERKGTMSLTYHVVPGSDGQPRMAPVSCIDSLHRELFEIRNIHLASFETNTLDVSGKAIDIQLKLKRGSARAVRLEVLKSPDGREHTDVVLHMPSAHRPYQCHVTVDTSFSSVGTTPQSRIPESAVFCLEKEELLDIRVLVDKCTLEVFANNRVVLMQMMYPVLKDSNGISLTAIGGDMVLEEAKVWQMGSIYK